MICASGEETKSKSKRLGDQSIILSTIGLIGVIVFVVVGTILARNVAASSNAPILSFFGAIVFYAFALACFLVVLLQAHRLQIGKDI